MSASTDRKFAKFLAFGSAMFGCTWAQVLAIGICLLCLCLCLWLCVCVSVNVRMFVLNSQDNLRLLCEATMRGCSSSIRRCLRFAKPAKISQKKAEKEHGMLCGIAWRRILQVSPQLVCAVRRSSQKGKHNNWLINALQVAAKTKLFSARGKTLINASLKSRQTTTRCKRLRVAAGAELFITSGQANTGEAAEGAGAAVVEGELGQLEESQQTACSQSATKTFAITRVGAEPRPGSEDTGMDTGTAMDMDMEKVDMEQLDIEEEEARLSKGAAQQCQRRRRRRRQKSQRGQAVKNEL